MIEIARYILAAIVVETHVWPLGAAWTGQISVFAFYTLSGYLMTRILNERYGFTPYGTVAFVINRVLRLWPAYMIVMALALVALRFWPLANFFFMIRTPASLADIITNATVLGQVTFDFTQWLPLAKPLVTSWSLSIEICCYLLLAVYFAKSPARLWMFAALGLIAMTISTGWCMASANPAAYGPYCFQNRYGVVQAGFLPFAFGGIYYFHQKTIETWLVTHRWIVTALLACAILAMFTGERLSATVGTYIGIPLTWTLLATARDMRPTRAQDFFGRASYHLFISHMPIAAVLVTGLGLPVNSILVYAATMAVALGLSSFLVPMERWINRTRQQVARSAAARGVATEPAANALGLSP